MNQKQKRRKQKEMHLLLLNNLNKQSKLIPKLLLCLPRIQFIMRTGIFINYLRVWREINMFYRAAAHSHLKQHKEAIEDCKLAITVDPTYTKAYSRMG